MQHSTDNMLNLSILTRISILLGFILFAFTDPHFIPINSIKQKAKFITTDNLRNVYLIDKTNQLTKYKPSGEKKYTFEEKGYGQLTQLDATNPFKILALFPDFSTVFMLDNTLSTTAVINLLDLGITRFNAACRSFDNNFWIYDEQDFRLKKIDINLEIIQQSDELFNIIPEKTFNPDFMLERNNWLYVNDPLIGIVVFDIYGTYYKTIPIKGLHNFQVYGDFLIYYKERSLIKYHLLTFEEQAIILPDTAGVRHARVEKGRLYLLKENQLDLYSYKN